MKRMFCGIAALALTVSLAGCKDKVQPTAQSQAATQMTQTESTSESTALPVGVFLTAKAEKTGTPLSQQELQEIQEACFSLDSEASMEIMHMLCGENTDAPIDVPIQYWYQTALISFYSSPENVNLLAMFYDGVGAALEPAEYGMTATLPEAELDRILHQVFDIGLEKMNLLSMLSDYDEANDCYYISKTDAYGAPVVTLLSGLRCDDGTLVIDYEIGNDEKRQMTMISTADGYRITSNLLLNYEEKAPFYEEDVLRSEEKELSYTLPLLTNYEESFGYYGTHAGQYMYEQVLRYYGYLQAQEGDPFVPTDVTFSAYRNIDTVSFIISEKYADRTDYHAFVLDLTCMEIASHRELLSRCETSDAVLSACVTKYLQENGLQDCSNEAQAQIDLESYGIFFDENGQLHIVLRLTNPDGSYKDHIVPIYNG